MIKSLQSVSDDILIKVLSFSRISTSFRHNSIVLFNLIVVSTCTDQQEMETQIVSAFDEVKENIEKQRAKMERAGMSADE